ncbi:hypothetical protein AB2I83_01070 [Escherichia coli]
MNNGTIDLQRNGFIATLVINRLSETQRINPRDARTTAGALPHVGN